MKPRQIEIVDEGGARLARVPLGKHNEFTPKRYAELWLDDYEFLCRLGLSPNWTSYHVKGKRYVSTGTVDCKGLRVHVARIIANASEGECVRFVDGNSLNLRRENLRIASRGKKRARYFRMEKPDEVAA